MADTDSLAQVVLAGVLDATENGLATALIDTPDGGWTPGICHGPPVVPIGGDSCVKTLGVFLDRIEVRPSGERQRSSPGEAQQQGIIAVAVARVHYFNCHVNLVAGGAQPSAADITASALRVLRGAWAIQCELVSRRKAQTLFTNSPDLELHHYFTERDVGIGTVLPLPVQGYSAGYSIGIEVALPLLLEDPS